MKTSMRTPVTQGRSRPSGGSITTHAVALLDHEHQRHQRAAVEHEQVVRRVGLDRTTRPTACAGAVVHLGADQLVHPELVVVELDVVGRAVRR